MTTFDPPGNRPTTWPYYLALFFCMCACVVASLIGSVSIEMQIFLGQKATSKKDLDAAIQALKLSHIHVQNPSMDSQQPKGMILSF